MKKKLLAVLSAAVLMLLSANVTACGSDDDDDDDNTTVDTSYYAQGKTDGEAFGAAYASVKENSSVTDNTAGYAKMVTYISKYKANENKTYRAGFLNGATGATDLAEEKILSLLNTDESSVTALAAALKEIFGGSTTD